MLLECKGYTPEKFEDVIICESEQKGKILKLTKAKFVNGPSTSMDTSSGYLETISTKDYGSMDGEKILSQALRLFSLHHPADDSEEQQ